MTKTRLIGIAGASGSGKTLVARNIAKRLGSDKVVIIQEDSFYRDLSHMPLEMRASQNFDHPDAFDHDLLAAHMQQLLNGHTVQCPMYDYITHNRRKETKTVVPHRLIILEGILVLSTPRLRDLMHMRVFVDTALDICCTRRLKRDMSERGRTLDSVCQQFEDTVRPMYLQHIEPSKAYADILIPKGGKNTVAMDLLIAEINMMLHKTDQ